MSDTRQRPDSWLASNGKWYPPVPPPIAPQVPPPPGPSPSEPAARKRPGARQVSRRAAVLVTLAMVVLFAVEFNVWTWANVQSPVEHVDNGPVAQFGRTVPATVWGVGLLAAILVITLGAIAASHRQRWCVVVALLLWAAWAWGVAVVFRWRITGEISRVSGFDVGGYERARDAALRFSNVWFAIGVVALVGAVTAHRLMSHRGGRSVTQPSNVRR